jgi:hypothetical protein
MRELQKNIEWEKLVEENPQIFVPPIYYGKVTKVYTGDTFTIITKIPFYNETIETASIHSFIIHLNLVAAPKIIPNGKNARDALYRKIFGKVVELRDVYCDKYGKIFANVYLENASINEWLLNNDYVFSCKNERRRRVSESDSHVYDKPKITLPNINLLIESSFPSKKIDNFILPLIERPNTASTSLETDCFLSHNWGEKQANHLKVKNINESLKTRGLKTWFDENKIDGNIRFKMAEGIDNTKCIVVFITREYRDKVNGIDMKDNCKYEFTYAMNQLGSQNMIPVIMEKEMRETNKWKGELGAALGSMLYVDLSVDVEIEKKYDELYKRIRHVIHRESKKI